MTRGRARRELLVAALVASFFAGVVVDRWLQSSRPPTVVQREAEPSRPVAEPQPSSVDRVIGAAPPPDPVRDDPAEPPTIAAAPGAVMEALPTQRFRLPIDGITAESLKDSFFERRGDRAHEAIDIVVPRGTPIYAVRDGTIAKLFYSERGGITIYHFEDDGRLCFYYAHLDRYADGLKEGQHVSQGEVIGFVGTSGNASPDTPHLHFAITELNADRKWWQGRVLDPYVVFTGKDED